MIPYGRQHISDDDVEAVIAALRSDWLTQGPGVPRFEDAVKAKVEAGYAVAVNSATSALHIACLALGVGSGDVVWTSPNTFVASANCARYCGAHVDFVDIDPCTYNVSTDALRRKLELAERNGRLPKVVIPVHFSGQSCDMRSIRELSTHYGFKVIEDASHAIGGQYLGRPIGSCLFSDITVFSFHPVKIITTCEGGLATTNDAQLAASMRRLRSHGITRDPSEMLTSEAAPWYYEQQELGFNYRMTDVQAALGESQLHRLSEYVLRRNALASRYSEALQGLPLQLPSTQAGATSAFHLYVVRVLKNAQGVTRDSLFALLRDQDIGVNVHYIPVHLQPYYRELGFVAGQYPEAEAYGREGITLPLFPTMAPSDQERVIRAVRGAFE